ncbi:MAG: hypothetical protein H6579_10575 [Chitinophagales bacterium]|nr:hypothetical protein [Chitinophagales bacterium]
MRTNRIFKSLLIASILMFSLNSCKEDEPQDQIAEPLVLDCNDLVATGASLILEDRGIGVDYIINCEASVRGDLSIDPNVTIQFGSDAGIKVYSSGSISAIGSPSSPIVFTGEDKVKGSWKGLFVDSDDAKNELSYCTLEYAGSGAFNSNGDIAGIILWADSRISINDCNIQFCDEYGIRADYSGYNVDINNTIITSCDAPMYVEANIVHRISGGNYTGNLLDVVRVRSDNGSRLIGTAQTWTNLGVPYRISDDSDGLRVTGGQLTINPGVTIEFENGQFLRVGESDASTLIAVGTASNPIVFTGVTKSAGAWGGISFYYTQSPQNEIGFATIEYAGASPYLGAIYMYVSPVLNAHDISFENISACGFYAAPTTTSNPNPNLSESNNTATNVSGGIIC